MRRTISYHEPELLHRLAAGEEAAFDELFLHNWDHVYSTALIMTKSAAIAEDIAQDAFFSLWKSRQSMAAVENLKGFLYTSVKFLVHKRLRRIKVEDAYSLYLAHKSTTRTAITEQESCLSLKEMQEHLQTGISQLPPQQQRAFKLSREQGLTHDQISELMGVSKKTVKDYIVRSIAFLRPYLKRFVCILMAPTALF